MTLSAGRPRAILNVVAGFGMATLAACSSAAPAAPTTSQSDATASAPPASAPAASAPTAGGEDGETDWCLNTVEEVAAAIDAEVAEAVSTDATGIGGGCIYNGPDATPVYAMSVVTAEGAVATFDAAKNGEGAVTIDGIGDDAVLISAGGPLAVLKGSTFISLGAFGPIMEDPAAFRAAMEELGKAAADRLP
ncbi:MAG: hypothetical protein M3406_01725 [Chloroflexota bacterium]|nr:hypothetical protein [Chloroflexota bacterium]